MITENDHLKRRCPMLGHEVIFAYCRAPGSTVPCRKVFDCWWESFPVEDFMKQHFSSDIIEKITAPPPPKTMSLLDMIAEAQRHCTEADKKEE